MRCMIRCSFVGTTTRRRHAKLSPWLHFTLPMFVDVINLYTSFISLRFISHMQSMLHVGIDGLD
jgi:hypothetical protein